MSTISLEKIQFALKKAKTLIESDLNLKAFYVLEQAFQACKNKYSAEAFKIAKKFLSICIQVLETSCSRLQIFKKAEMLIIGFLGTCLKQNWKVKEKMFKQMLWVFNWGLLLYRKYAGLLGSLGYVARLVGVGEGIGADGFEGLAKFYLNVCSVCLGIRKYQECVRWAEEALKYLQKVVRIRCFDSVEVGVEQKEVILGYVLAFYCIFVGQYRCGQMDLAVQALQNAVNIGCKDFNRNNELFSTVMNLSEQVKKSEKGLLSIKKVKKSLFHLSLASSLSDFHFFEKGNKEKLKKEEKLPGRYYTKSQLEAKTKYLDTLSQPNFMSADTYFFQEISKSIHIKPSPTSIKTPVNLNKKAWIREENLEKRKISELRLKKQYRSTSASPSEVLPARFLTTKAFEPDLEMCNKEKLVILITCQKFKSLLLKICGFNKQQKIFPSQKLFFKPKAYSPRQIETPDNLEVNSIVNSQRRHSLYESAKDEIADLMNGINHEIRVMYSDRDSSKLTSPSICGSVRSVKDSLLCKSVIRHKNSSEKQFKQIKSSINASLKSRRRFLRRQSTLKDLQV